jgi:Kdo2-lipid IVA lauroyltransferase/acyltransferase
MLKKTKNLISYYFIRSATYFLGFLPLKVIHLIGNFLGYFSYYFLADFRKTALSNLALAKSLNLSNSDILKISKKSFQNLAINILEYAYFHQRNSQMLSKKIICKNPHIANEFALQKKGLIFFCAHQSNFEALFIDGTKQMEGIAIGKPIKNPFLYKWIKSIREKNNGRIIEPRNALKEGLKGLRRGVFLGIVGDQAMPNSGYSYNFFNRRAHLTTAPALLSYRTSSPIIVATTKRYFGRYEIIYSDPIFPNLSNPSDIEVKNLMDKSLSILEKSIEESPHEWLWQHNFYKQQSPKEIFKKYRKDTILIVLPNTEEEFSKAVDGLKTLRDIYKNNFLFLLSPKKFEEKIPFKQSFEEIFYYKKNSEMLLEDYRFKLVYDFSNTKSLKKHFKKLSAFDVFTIKDLAKTSVNNTSVANYSDIIKNAVLRNYVSRNYVSRNHVSQNTKI